MMQNSAVSFSIRIDNDKYRVPLLIADLQKDFKVSYNQQLTLYTVRHYKKEDLDILLRNKKILLEQKSRNTILFPINSSDTSGNVSLPDLNEGIEIIQNGKQNIMKILQELNLS